MNRYARPTAAIPSRREFLQSTTAASAGLLTSNCLSSQTKADEADNLIHDISRSVLWKYRGKRVGWFHPRACMVRTKQGVKALMTMQTISGSDVFGHVHWSESSDLGKTWSEPQPIDGLGRQPISKNEGEGVCDVSPDYHARTNTVLALGHNVYYRNGHLARPQGRRHPVYTVRDAQDVWQKPRKLEWDDPRGWQIYTSNCGQRIMLPDGDILIPMSYGPKGYKHRRVTSALCSFDGERLAIKKVGSELTLNKGRGLLEPSVAVLDGQYYLTIRAEDGRGYVSASEDGLEWQKQEAWKWDDGKPLGMSTTQQHWLCHSDGLFLVYTRRAPQNANVFRWRAPIYMAQVDRETLRLVRDTEQIVMPIVGDGIKNPRHVARMGNFHITNASTHESWVTVGETLPDDRWQGNTLLARIRWNRPNRLVVATS